MALMAGTITAQAKSTDMPTGLSRYPGFYASGPFQVAEVTLFDNQLAVQPPYWSSRPNLARLADTAYFQSLPQPDRRRVVKFGDFAQGAPQEIALSGFGEDNEGVRFRRVAAGREPPGLLVLKGQPAAAATRAMQAAIGDVAAFSLRTVQSRPRSAESVVAFIDQYLRMKSVQPTADMLFARGLGRLMLRQRQGALSDFKAVVALQPSNDEAKEYVALLNVSEPPDGEGYRRLLPFKLDDLYAPPTSSEIATVLTDWASRDLAPGKVEAVHSTTLNCGGVSYGVRILKHDNRGAAHYGALLLPRGGKGRLATIIDVRGVNPSFSSMNLDECTTLLRTLGDEARRLAVLIPGMNGHEMQLEGHSFKSGGDPSDSWDGGADAVLSLLNAALVAEPRLDASKVAIHGHSRGGGVAMLAAIRDKRISLVLSRSGPVDWFEAMQPVDGISWADSLRLALSGGKPPAPNSRVSQHYDTFIDRVVIDGETLKQTRHRMIASSAYYFAERLPETHAFYGDEDRAVVPLNARMLALRVGIAGHLQSGSTVELYEGVGHDTDWHRSSVVISRALKKWLRH